MILDQIDGLIRAGRAKEARAELRRSSGRKFPRASLARFANLCRRAELPDLAVRLLNPVIRPSRKTPADATENERSEYGASLIRLGAVDEGLELLGTLTDPESLLFRAFGLVARWGYGEAIDLLEAYLRSKNLTPYQNLVGRMNLCASLVAERRHAPAERLLAELLDETKRDGHGLLHAKALQLGAQSSLAQGEWRETARCLRESSRLLGESGTLDRLLLRKWEAILARLRDPSARTKPALASVRKEAIALRHWETVRQCDAYEVIAAGNRTLALRVFFGTPFESFRTRFVDDLKFPLQPPAHYLWHDARKPGIVLDVETGEAPRAALKEGMALHRLLRALARDFYRPHRLAGLHHELFPQEYFNPSSSPGRVQKIIRRFRDWTRAARLPLRLHTSTAGYALALEGSIALRITADTSDANRGARLLARLRREFGDRAFTAFEAARVLDLTPRAALGILRAGSVPSEGRARATVYRFRPAA